MKATLAALAAFVAVAVATTAAFAQYNYAPPAYYPGQYCYPAQVAPDMCSSYFYYNDGCTWYGPSYNVYPPFPPFGGVAPGPLQIAPVFHPWARSPRDFFMWTEAQKERYTRETRPPFVP
jgi:hypothetical protein